MKTGCSDPHRGGFTLAEAILAITISALVVIMASNVFLVQNDFYSFLLQRSKVQDNARTFLEVVGEEVQAVHADGLIRAESTEIIYRTPQSMGAICAVVGPDAYIHWSNPGSIDLSLATGIAALDAPSDEWVYGSATVSLSDVGIGAASVCAGAGADTTGAVPAFSRVANLGAITGLSHGVGDVVMIFEEIQLLIDTSVLDPSLLALYRGPNGGVLTEYATGVAPDARFQYWTPQGQGMWRNRLGTGLLDRTEKIRVVASTFQRAETGGGTDAEYSLVVDLDLRNR
jgi:hypothetical protein